MHTYVHCPLCQPRTGVQSVEGIGMWSGERWKTQDYFTRCGLSACSCSYVC